MSYFRTQNSATTFSSSRRQRQATANRQWQRNQNTVAFAPKVSLGPVAHTIIIALLVAILGLIYLSQVTKTSSYGYELDRQNTEMATLTAERQGLEIENARLQALSRVADSSIAKSMVEPTSTDYATR
ncbi:hypothetical protein EOL73_00855 [Candidatus Saccharibacteria bacterium]|nr:hypothetical protein [Candidatus Saccharibacteria bacterium]